MGLFGARARGGLRRRVERDLDAVATWKVRVNNRWVCPFCVQLVKVRRDDPLADKVLDHLDGNCEQFRDGDGEERPLAELKRVATQRELRRYVKNELVTNASWQLLDLNRRWFCPFCGDATSASIPKNRKMTEDVLQGILDHVESCYAYDRGRGQEKAFAHLKAIVKYANQSRKLAENVRRKLEGDPAWRRKDPHSRWICPYCLKPQDHIDLSSNLLMFENAPGLIAKHLAASCDDFRRGAQPKPLETPTQSGPMRAASGLDYPEAAQEQTGTGSLIPGTVHSLQVPDTGSEQFPARPSERLPARPSERLPAKPSERLGAWGRDGIQAEELHAPTEGGTTLRSLESSGEYLLIDDPEVRSITKSGKTKAVEEWRREIERELASVRQIAPAGISGEISLTSSQVRDMEDMNGLARRLSLPERGIELRRLNMMAKPPRGDFAEILDLGQGRIGLCAGGVAGEEAEAGLISAMARTQIRKHAGPDCCPGDLLRRVNADVYADLDGRSFVAVTYVLFDLRSNRARIARAGLSAPVVLNPARNPDLRPLDSEGMVIGIDKGPIFDNTLEVVTVELAPEDLLVIFSNGVLEGRGANREEFGLARMHRVIRKYGTHELDYFIDKFKEHYNLHAQSPSRRTSDACLIAIKRFKNPLEG